MTEPFDVKPQEARAPRLILGTAQLVPGYGITAGHSQETPHRSACELLQAAEAEGVVAIDTAPSYRGAEQAVGRCRWSGQVSTKIEPGVPVDRSLDRSLMRLGRRAVDVLYLHEAAEVLVADSPIIAAAEQRVGRGVRALGASIYEVEQFCAAVAHPSISAVQAPLNVFDRRINDSLLADASSQSVSVVARSVFLQGVLLADPEQLPAAVKGLAPYVVQLQHIATKTGRSVSDLVIGWMRARPGIDAIVVGATSPEEIASVGQAMRAAPLSLDVLDAIDAIDMPPRELTDPRRWTPAP